MIRFAPILLAAGFATPLAAQSTADSGATAEQAEKAGDYDRALQLAQAQALACEARQGPGRTAVCAIIWHEVVRVANLAGDAGAAQLANERWIAATRPIQALQARAITAGSVAFMAAGLAPDQPPEFDLASGRAVIQRELAPGNKLAPRRQVELYRALVQIEFAAGRPDQALAAARQALARNADEERRLLAEGEVGLTGLCNQEYREILSDLEYWGRWDAAAGGRVEAIARQRRLFAMIERIYAELGPDLPPEKAAEKARHGADFATALGERFWELAHNLAARGRHADAACFYLDSYRRWRHFIPELHPRHGARLEETARNLAALPAGRPSARHFYREAMRVVALRQHYLARQEASATWERARALPAYRGAVATNWGLAASSP